MTLVHENVPVQWPARLVPDRLAALAFETPYLAGDVTVVADRYVQFRSGMPGIEPYYAVKANPAREVISTLAGLGAGFQVGSFSELATVLDAGVEGTRVLFGGAVRSGPQLRSAASAGVWRFGFDTGTELHRIAEHAPGSCVYLQLRVSPDEARPIGAEPAQAGELMTLARDLGLVPYGLSFHLGTNRSRPDVWIPAIRTAGEVMSDLLAEDIGLAMLDIGGGFPVRYTEKATPIEEFGAALGLGLDALLPYRPAQVVAEPGRYLVAESGILVATVLDRSRRAGIDWLVLDAGVHQGLADAGAYPVSTPTDRPGDLPHALFCLAGPTSDSSDVIAWGVSLPEAIAPGDLVMFGSAGAYSTVRAGGHHGFAQARQLFV